MRAVAILKGNCKVCQAPEPARVATNRAIWPDGASRSPNYRVAGMAAMAAVGPIEAKTITRHAEHTEATWRMASVGAPIDVDGHEAPVLTDFGSVAEMAAKVGMRALGLIDAAIVAKTIDPKDAMAAARLGVAASAKREDQRIRAKSPQADFLAIFAVVAGHAPEEHLTGGTRNVTPIDDMKALVAEERRRLLELAAGSPADATD